MKEESKLPDGLEEAAEKYADGPECSWVGTSALEAAFKAGAEWQKKIDDLETADLLAIAHLQGMEQQKAKMMKEAVEGFVGVHLHDKRADVTVNTGYLPKEMGIKADSKVKVIIVKED